MTELRTRAVISSIEGITLIRVEETNILVTWNHSNDLNVKGYKIHISSEDYSDSSMLYVNQTIANSFLITRAEFSDLSNDSDWYISVTTFDDDLERKSVDAKRIPPSTPLVKLAKRLPQRTALNRF